MTVDEDAARKFPATFKSELAAILAGARNGGTISPRRNQGLLVELERAKKRYAAKIALLRGHGQSPVIDDAERAIEKIASEFVAALAVSKAA